MGDIRKMKPGDSIGLPAIEGARYAPIPEPFHRDLKRWWSFRSDLSSAVSFLERSRAARDDDDARVAFFITGLVYYCRCFGKGGGRERLDHRVVFANEAEDLITHHEFYVDKVRNKHLAHPTNADLEQFKAHFVLLPDGALGTGQLGISWTGPDDEMLDDFIATAQHAYEYCDTKLQGAMDRAMIEGRSMLPPS